MTDLAKATEIARNMVMRYGMHEVTGPVTYLGDPQSFLGTPQMREPRTFSEETSRQIDSAVRGILDSGFTRAVEILTKRRALLESSAADLLLKETLGQEELAAIRDAVSKQE